MVASAPPARAKGRATFRSLEIDQLHPTPDNRRRHISNASVESLARSMKHDGVLQPIVVRPHPSKKGHWEIRAGERRWRAAKLAGLTHLPAIIRSLDDPTALSVTIAENMQRQDPHPLEEAATIQQAFDRDYDIKAIAAKLGKSVQYVARRASLTRLTKAWKDEILKPDSDAGQLSVAHLELIARLPAETQDLLSDNDFSPVFGRGFPTVEELRRVIDGSTHTLRTMSWPLDDETLDPKAGSCIACPKRSSCRPMLFDDEEPSDNGKVSKTDRCLDPQCFDRKQTAFVQRREAELRQQHPNLQLVQVGYSRLSEAADQAFGERIAHVYSPTYVKASDKRGTPAMQIDGPKAGELVYLNLGGAEQLNGKAKKQRPRDAQGKVVPMTMDERKARLQKRRDAFVVKHMGERLRKIKLEDCLSVVNQLPPWTSDDPKLVDVHALVLAFGTTGRADRPYGDDDPWKSYDNLHKSPIENRLAAALHGVVQIWDRRMHVSDNSIVGKLARESGRVAQVLGIDIEAIQAEAVKALPVPKAWGTLTDNDDDSSTNGESSAAVATPSPSLNGQRKKAQRSSHRTHKNALRNHRRTSKPRGRAPRKRRRG
jgi:ParB/RepB/Spo0J family partition protein